MDDTPGQPDPSPSSRSHSSTDRNSPRRPPLGDLQPRARFSLAYYLLYSEFRSRLKTGEIEHLVVPEDQLYGEMRAEASAAADTAPRKLDKQIEGPAKGLAEGNAKRRDLELPAPKAPWPIGRLIDRFRSLRGDFQRDLAAREAAAKLYFTVVRLEDSKLLDDLQRVGDGYPGTGFGGSAYSEALARDLDAETVASVLGKRPEIAAWGARRIAPSADTP